jgi:hypothetical protein
MREAVTAEFLRGMRQVTGRYYVSFKIDRVADQRSQVIISALIILENAELSSPIGGRIVPSNGSLEKQYSETVLQAVQPLR